MSLILSERDENECISAFWRLRDWILRSTDYDTVKQAAITTRYVYKYKKNDDSHTICSTLSDQYKGLLHVSYYPERAMGHRFVFLNKSNMENLLNASRSVDWSKTPNDPVLPPVSEKRVRPFILVDEKENKKIINVTTDFIFFENPSNNLNLAGIANISFDYNTGINISTPVRVMFYQDKPAQIEAKINMSDFKKMHIDDFQKVLREINNFISEVRNKQEQLLENMLFNNRHEDHPAL